MNDATPPVQYAFEDAEVPPGIDMRPIEPMLIPSEAYISRAYAELENERQSKLLSEHVAAIASLDQKISDQQRALKVHHDRVTALQSQQRREHIARLEQERAETVASLEKAFTKSHAKAVELEAAVKVLGDTLFELLEAREVAFAR